MFGDILVAYFHERTMLDSNISLLDAYTFDTQVNFDTFLSFIFGTIQYNGHDVGRIWGRSLDLGMILGDLTMNTKNFK